MKQSLELESVAPNNGLNVGWGEQMTEVIPVFRLKHQHTEMKKPSSGDGFGRKGQQFKFGNY